MHMIYPFGKNIHELQNNFIEDISIVMPVYNHEDTVSKAIESALMQEMPYSSIVYCINDASTDTSSEILSYYSKKHPDKIKIYTSIENQGSGKKSYYHNRPPVRGRFWCLLAGDDYWTSKDKLAKQISFLDINTDYVGCSCNSLVKNETTGEESIIRPDRNVWNFLDLVLLRNRYAFYVHTTSIVWRNIFLDKGFFLPPSFRNKHAFGDVILMHMMLAKGGKMYNIQKEMSCYRVTGKGVWTNKSEHEKEEMNKILMNNINLSIPLKYKIAIHLQKFKRYSNVLKTLIPGPVNE